MIKLTNVSKSFSGFQALKKVSFEVKEGGITAFLGVNGAGKTTTMRIIDGIIPADEGEVQVGQYSPLHQAVKVKEIVGYLPEDNPLYSSFRVSEYLNFIARLRRIEGFPSEMYSLLRQMGVTKVWDQRISTLSHGYRQRVGLTAALIHRPQVLVLDEPLSGLDPLQKEEIMALLEKISRQTTILFSTHILPEVEKLCQRVIIIHQGEIRFQGDLSHLKGEVIIKLSYQGKGKIKDKLLTQPNLQLVKAEELKRGSWQLTLKLTKGDKEKVIRQISKIVSGEGGLVLQLQPLQEDLSTLFNRLVKNEEN